MQIFPSKSAGNILYIHVMQIYIHLSKKAIINMSGKIHGNHYYATGDCLNGNVNKLLMVFKWTMDYDGYMMIIIMVKDDE